MGETNAFCLSISSPRRSHRRRRRNRIAPLGKPEPFRCVVVRAALSSFLRHRFYTHRLCPLLVGRSLVFPRLLFVLPVVSLRAKTDGGGVATRRKHHLSLFSLLLSLSLCLCVSVTFNGRQKLFLSLSESTFTLPVTLSFFEVFSILSEISSFRDTRQRVCLRYQPHRRWSPRLVRLIRARVIRARAEVLLVGVFFFEEETTKKKGKEQKPLHDGNTRTNERRRTRRV